MSAVRVRAAELIRPASLTWTDVLPTVERVSASAGVARLGGRASSTAVPDPIAGLHLPKTPGDTILRPRLFDLLSAGAAERALTLVSGPPGAGKTVLLASWLRERRPEAKLAWISLHEHDGIPFWQRLIDAVRPAPAGQRAPPVQRGTGEAASAFIEAVEQLERPLVVVLDDLHHAAPTVLTDLDRILRSPPTELHFVAASRIDPPLSLHLLRVAGDLMEVRAQQLAFDEPEARELLAGMSLELEEDTLAAVLARTEGWAAGLRLLGLSLQAQEGKPSVVERLTVDERPVAEFLAAEVLATQPPDVRLFLLRTSIVDSLDGELANELTGRRDGERLLERLLHDNLFVDRAAGGVYRYHQLFGALLRAEAQYELGDELVALHERAAVCLARRGRPVAALTHAVGAERWELVSVLLAEHWSAIFASAEGRPAAGVLEALSPARAAECTVVAAFSALLRIAAGNVRGEAALLADAQSRRAEFAAAARPGFDALVRYASALAARTRGNLTQAARLAALGLERAPVEAASTASEDQRRALGLATLGAAELWDGATEEAQSTLEEALDVSRRAGTIVAEIDALSHLALLELNAGQLRRAARVARAALELERTHACGVGPAVLARIVLALVQHAWGDLDAAQAALASVDALTRRSGDVPGRVLAAVAAAMVALSEGGDAADDAVLRLRSMRRRVAVPALLSGRLAALEARLLAKTARLDDAAAVVAAAEPESEPALAVAAARIQLALGSPFGALEALEARPRGSLYVEIEARLTEAIALRGSGEEDAALVALEDALALAEPEAVRRPFVDAGGALRDLLGAHLRRTNAHRWLAAELVAFLDDRATPEGVAPGELVEALSDRESEVLHYLPTIMSNADIAGELFVSVNTVKTHVKSIYRKLGATRRQDAVRRARQLRLL